MTTPPADDEWSRPTLYNARQRVEPRLFTEADPIGSLLVADVDERRGDDVDSDPESGRHRATPTWGSTTIVGKPRRVRSPAPSARPATEAPARPRPGGGVAGGGVAAGDVGPGGIVEPEGSAQQAGPTGTAIHPAVPEPGETVAVGTPLDPDPGETLVADERSNRGLLAASGSMAVATLVSRVTGFLRTIFIVAALGVIGPHSVGNAYNSANTFPNMVYELLLGGVLSSVLVPLLVHAQSEDDDGGTAYTQRLLSIAALALGAMTILAVLAAPLISAAFVQPGPGRALTSIFATLLLPEIFFYGLGAMFMAVLNIRHSYRPGAWSPVLNNVIMIATIAVFWLLPGPATLSPTTITTTQIVVLGVGTTLGIAAQAFVLLPALRRVGFRWQWRFRGRPEDAGRLREIGVLGGWVLAYVVVSQIGVSVIQYVGNRNDGYTVFTNVDLLFQMPYGILVVSLLTAIMPRLSRAAMRQDDDAVKDDLGLGAQLSAIGMVPITVGLIVLGPVMAVTLFAHGQNSVDNGRLIGSALAYSAFGLFPFAVVMLQLRVFYAMRDGRTPTVINAFMAASKVVLVLVSDRLLDGAHAIEWLNISTSLSYVIGAVVGHVVLTRRLGHLGFGPVATTVVQIGFASVLGGAAAYGIVRLSTGTLGDAHAGSAVGLVAGAVVGVAVMAGVAWRMRIPALHQAMAGVRGR